MCLDAGKNGQIAGSDSRSGALERRKHCAARLRLPGNPAVCYRPRRSRVHLGNVGLTRSARSGDTPQTRTPMAALLAVSLFLSAVIGLASMSQCFAQNAGGVFGIGGPLGARGGL